MDVIEIVGLFVGLSLVVALPLVALLRWTEVISARRQRQSATKIGTERVEPAVERRPEPTVGMVGQPT
jgi:hypothetical protein